MIVEPGTVNNTMFWQRKVWIDQSGEVWPIDSMSSTHISNTINYIHRRIDHPDFAIFIILGRPFPSGNMDDGTFSIYMEECNRQDDAILVGDSSVLPVVQALKEELATRIPNLNITPLPTEGEQA